MVAGRALGAALSLLALCLAADAAADPGRAGTPAQPAATGVQSRGVLILRPVDEAPAPAPAPAPHTDAIAAAPASPAPRPSPQVVSLPVAPAPVLRACPRPFASPDLALSDGRRFRSALQARLSRNSGPVVVDLPKPFAISGATPPALAPWLSEVKASGGLVSVEQYCDQSRGFFSFLRNLLGGGRSSPYKAADGYDAVFHVDGLAGKVTQVEFKPRALQ